MRSTISIRKFLLGGAAILALSACDTNKPDPAEINKVNDQIETKAASSLAENTILEKWTGPYDGVPAWDKIKVSD